MKIFQNFLKVSIFFTLLSVLTKLSAQEFCECPCASHPACWQGFYLSGQVGGGWNREHGRFTNLNYFNTLGPILQGSHFKNRSNGFVGGGAAGYNYQLKSWVIGVEGGALSTNLKKIRPSPWFPATDIFSSHIQYIATAKARLGYAYGNLLPYLAGGWAGGHYKMKFEDRSSTQVAKVKSWTNGWTIGAGVDYKFAESFSIGVAYDYIHLQFHNKSTSCPNCGTGVGKGTPRIDNRFQIQTLVLRLNYLFKL